MEAGNLKSRTVGFLEWGERMKYRVLIPGIIYGMLVLLAGILTRII